MYNKIFNENYNREQKGFILAKLHTDELQLKGEKFECCEPFIRIIKS